MYEDEECLREDHVDVSTFKDCPRCDSKNIIIKESLKVWAYCDRHHLIDFVECLDCDVIISIDLLIRLEKAEKDHTHVCEAPPYEHVYEEGEQPEI